MTDTAETRGLRLVRQRFSELGLEYAEIDVRAYPEETIFVVHVDAGDFTKAAGLGNRIDEELARDGIDGFVTVRRAKQGSRRERERQRSLHGGVRDDRVVGFASVLEGRSRASEIQPSLEYVPDTGDNLASILTEHNHLVFGRRGAGKSALMAEAKRVLEARGDCLIVWLNIQTYRAEGPDRVFLWTCRAILERVLSRQVELGDSIVAEARRMAQDCDELLAQRAAEHADAARLVPRLQTMLRRSLVQLNAKLYVFLDDLHYLTPRSRQPLLLDMIHGAVRDCPAWMKVASIRHLSRWFQTSPPLGLQTGHDAKHIDLDASLATPTEAKSFLEKILARYAAHAGVSFSQVFAPRSRDRLVLASGAVPRDYLVLAASAIREARKRSARLVGVEDVNRAAGAAAQVKLRELEDDAAAGTAHAQLVAAFRDVRSFCLDEKKCTFFRVDFRDKEQHADEYSLLQALLDSRLLHLVNAGVSDPHEAGRRAEAYMLDLSQFSSERLKKHLRVLDYLGGHMVMKKTATASPAKIGSTARRLLAILRTGPELPLSRFSASLSLADGASVPIEPT